MNVPNLILTEGAIADLVSNKKLSSPVVQVLNYKFVMSAENRERIRFLISDGKYSYSFAWLAIQLNHMVTEGDIKPNAIIRIDRYNCCSVFNEKIVMVILDFTVLAQGADVGHVIGNPTSYISPAEPQKEEAADVPIPDLNEGAIADLVSNKKLSSLVVQFLGYKILSAENRERIRVLISDGKYSYSYAMLATQLNHIVTEGGMEPNTIIRINIYNRCNVMNEKIVIVILDFTVLVKGADVGHRIDNPTSYIAPAEPQNEDAEDVLIPDLTEWSIADFLSNRKVDSPIVQILSYRSIRGNDGGERFRFYISDGKYAYSYAMLATQHNHMVTAGYLEPSTVIRIDECVINNSQDKKVLVITNLTVLAKEADVGYRIGNPISYKELAMP